MFIGKMNIMGGRHDIFQRSSSHKLNIFFNVLLLNYTEINGDILSV